MEPSAIERTREAETPWEAPPFSPLPRGVLRGIERYTVGLGEAINTRPALKRWAATYSYHVPRPFVTWASQRRWRLYGSENLSRLRPQRGVILVSNHRSFFDMYVAAAAIFVHADFIERLYFPVRANFFYDHPAGALVNFVMSGYAMWPPVFRDDRKARLNPIGVRQMAHVLSSPGAVLGIHPEGTRQKGPDPYVLGAARPGVGRLVEQCPPDTLVLPFFILGLGNDFLHEVRLRLRRDPGPEIRMHWGTPLRCDELRAGGGDAQGIADALLQMIHDLGQQDRAIAPSRPSH